MESKILGFKKGARVFDMVMFLIVGLFIFIIGFTFLSQKSQVVTDPISSQYQEDFNKLDAQADELNQELINFKDIAGKITEAGPFEYAYYGLKVVLGVMQFPGTLLNMVLTSFGLGSRFTSGVIPSEVITYLSIGLSAIMIFAIVAFITNRAREP